MLALGGLGDGRLSMDLINEPLESPVSFDRLFDEARVCVPQLWGSDYPIEELIDDIENYRPLKFLYACQKLKLRVWKTGKAVVSGAQEVVSTGVLWKDIEQLGQVPCLFAQYTRKLTISAGLLRRAAVGKVHFPHTWSSCCLDYLSCLP